MIPNRVYNRYIVLLSLAVQTIVVYAQDCYNVVAIYKPEEHQLARYNYANIKEVVPTDTGYILMLDTTSHNIFQHTYVMENAKCIVNDTAYTVTCIFNDGDTVAYNKIDLFRTISTPNSLLILALDYNRRKKENKLITVNDSTVEMRNIQMPGGDFVGNNDTALFMVSRKFKYNKMKYPEGTLCYIDASGFHIVDDSVLTQLVATKPVYPMHYYAAPYFVQYTGYTTESFQCATLHRTHYSIWYNERLIDTIEVLHNFTTPVPAIISGDTLKLRYYAYTEDGASKHGFERIYVAGKLISSWDPNTIDFSGIGSSFLSGVGEYMVIDYTRFIRTEQINGSYTSENGLTLTSAGYMPVFMLYHKDTHAFLGYPHLVVKYPHAR